MTRELKKFLATTLAIILTLPLSLLARPQVALAAPTVGGGAAAVVSIGNPPVTLSTVNVVEGLINDFTAGSPPGNGIQISLTSGTSAAIRFYGPSVTVDPSPTLDVGAGPGNPQSVTVTDGSLTIDIPIVATDGSSIESFTIDGIKVDATASGTTAAYAGSENIVVTVAGGSASGAAFTVDAQLPVVTTGNIGINTGLGAGLTLPQASYIIDSVISVTWDNTGGGDNNADIASATTDFSQFGGPTAQPMSNTAGTWTADYTVIEGNNNANNRKVSVTATDVNNNSTTTQDGANRSLENTRPQSVFTSTPLAITNDNTPTFSGITTDSGTGAQIGNIEYQIIGPTSIGWTSLPASDGVYNEATEEFDFTTSVLLDGNYTAEVRGTDKAGNIENTATYSFSIDTAPPFDASLSLSDQDSGSTTYTNSQLINAVISNDTDAVAWLLSETQSTQPLASDPNWQTSEPSTFSLSAVDGSKTVYIWTKDVAENVSNLGNSASITLDTQTPNDPTNINSSSHTPSIWSSDNTIDINWTAATDNGPSGIDGYSFSFTQGATDPLLDATKDIEETATTVTSLALSPDGEWWFHIRTVDNAGNWTATEDLGPFFIDISEPNSTLNLYLPDPTNDNTPIYTGTAVSSFSPIAAVEYRVDGSGWLAALPSDGAFDSLSEDFNFTIGVLGEGTHTIEVRAQNGAGTWETSFSSDTLTVDTLAPVVTITNPPGLLTADNTPTFEGTVTDTSTITLVEYQVDGGSWLGASGTNSWSFTTSELSDGSHTVSVRATDEATNIGTSVPYTFEVDTTPPVNPFIQINSGNTYTNTNLVSLSLYATDSNGVATMRLSNDASNWTAQVPYVTSYLAWDLTDPVYGGNTNNGSKTVYAIFYDSLGNPIGGFLPAAFDSIILDNEAPTSSSSSVGATNTSPIPVSFTANDSFGVAFTQLWYKKEAGGSWTNTGITLSGNTGSFDFVPSDGEGTYYFATKAYDNAGNSEANPSGAGDSATVFDTTAPTGTVAVGSPTLFDGDLVQEVTITYSEPMDPASTPTVNFGATAGTWTPTGGSWTANNIWQQNFTLSDANETVGGVTVSSSGAQDLAGNPEGASNADNFNVDTQNPILAEVTPVPTPTNDTTPDYTFSTDEAGAIAYGGLCSSATTNAVPVNNTITFNALAEGTYNTCTITVTDAVGNQSNSLGISQFIVDTTLPADASLSLSDQDSGSTTYTNSQLVNAAITNDIDAVAWLLSETQSTQPLASDPNWQTSEPSTFTLSLGDGSKTVYIWTKDVAENVSAQGNSASITLDTQTPNDPTNINSSSHTPSIWSSDNTIDVNWTAATDNGPSGIDGYSYEFTTGATDVPDATKDLEETDTVVTSSSLSDGSWYFHIRTVDNAGNWTATSHYGPFLIDTTLPSAPTINPVTTPVDADSQTVTGTAEANSLVRITGGVSGVTQQLTGGATNFSMTVLLHQNSTNILSVTATDAAGNVSSATQASIAEDSISPDPPTLLDPTSDRTVNQDKYTIKGANEEKATIKIYRDSNNNNLIDTGEIVVATTETTATGFELEVYLDQNAPNYFLVTATDLASNESGLADVPAIVEDSQAPSTATTASPVNQTISPDEELVFEGQTDPGAEVTVEIFSFYLKKSTKADAAGFWKIVIKAQEIGPGSHRAVITIVDLAGNKSQSLLGSFRILSPMPLISEELARAALRAIVPEAKAAPPAEAKVPEGQIKAGEAPEEAAARTSRIVTLIALLIIALGVGTAGYYAYSWWAEGTQIREREALRPMEPEKKRRPRGKPRGRPRGRTPPSARW